MPRTSNPPPRHPPEAVHFARKRVVVIAASMLAMLVAAAVAWLAMGAWSKSVDTSAILPIQDVTFVGDMKRVDAAELKRVAGGIRGSMLRTDLNDVKAAIRQVHWVRNAEVRRRFPGTLEISVEEHLPFAKWKHGNVEQMSMVNTFGEVFEAGFDDVLPVFAGPPGASREVLASYIAFQSQLAVIQRTPVAVSLSARRAWQLTLDNGTVLELGRGEAGVRLARYVRAYPAVQALQLADARVDLRYQSGMAVKDALAASPKPARKTTSKS